MAEHKKVASKVKKIETLNENIRIDIDKICELMKDYNLAKIRKEKLTKEKEIKPNNKNIENILNTINKNYNNIIQFSVLAIQEIRNMDE